MSWALLIIAGVLEIGFATCLMLSDGFTRLLPALATISFGLGSVVLLSLALRSLPVGAGYAVWTGIGAAGTAVVGMAFLSDSVSLGRLLCIVLILAGVIGLKLVPDI